jgi:hypothetical protein
MSTSIVPVEHSSHLAKLSQARQMLAESRTLPEIKQIRDMAQAARTYARAAHLGRESQDYAAEISLLASHKAGEILSQLERGKTGPKKLSAKAAGNSEYAKTLNDTNTPERTAQGWQQIAKIPLKAVQDYVTQARTLHSEISQNGLLKVAARQAKANAPTPITPPQQPTVSASGITARLTALLAELGALSAFTKGVKSRELDSESRTEVETLIASLRKISKDAAERADRLEAALTRVAEVA